MTWWAWLLIALVACVIWFVVMAVTAPHDPSDDWPGDNQ